MNATDAKNQLEKQYKRQNEYIKRNFKRVSVVLPLSQWKQITEKIGQNGSMNSYIRGLIDADLKNCLPVSDPNAQAGPEMVPKRLDLSEESERMPRD